MSNRRGECCGRYPNPKVPADLWGYAAVLPRTAWRYDRADEGMIGVLQNTWWSRLPSSSPDPDQFFHLGSIGSTEGRTCATCRRRIRRASPRRRRARLPAKVYCWVRSVGGTQVISLEIASSSARPLWSDRHLPKSSHRRADVRRAVSLRKLLYTSPAFGPVLARTGARREPLK